MNGAHLDARRLLCPLPVIRTQAKVQQLSDGDTLSIVCTDPGAAYDIPAWCRVHGHRVLAIEELDDEITIRIRVGES